MKHQHSLAASSKRWSNTAPRESQVIRSIRIALIFATIVVACVDGSLHQFLTDAGTNDQVLTNHQPLILNLFDKPTINLQLRHRRSSLESSGALTNENESAQVSGVDRSLTSVQPTQETEPATTAELDQPAQEPVPTEQFQQPREQPQNFEEQLQQPQGQSQQLVQDEQHRRHQQLAPQLLDINSLSSEPATADGMSREPWSQEGLQGFQNNNNGEFDANKDIESFDALVGNEANSDDNGLGELATMGQELSPKEVAQITAAGTARGMLSGRQAFLDANSEQQALQERYPSLNVAQEPNVAKAVTSKTNDEYDGNDEDYDGNSAKSKAASLHKVAGQISSPIAAVKASDLSVAAGHHYKKKKKKKKKIIIIKKKKKKVKKKKKKKKVKKVIIIKKKKKKKVYHKKKKVKKKHHGHDHGKYYMYAKVPKKNAWEFGYKKGNKKHTISRHEKGYKSKFKTKVTWHDKKSKGKESTNWKQVQVDIQFGVHIWDYNHTDKKHKKHH